MFGEQIVVASWESTVNLEVKVFISNQSNLNGESKLKCYHVFHPNCINNWLNQFVDASKNVIYKTIEKVIDDKTFTVTELFENNDCDDLSLFLYGQEVNDFLTINKDSIFTIATSALQQVDKELQETKQIVARQQVEIEELKSCYTDLLERLRTAGIP
jgi:hemerythrin-like domain-containing protein